MVLGGGALESAGLRALFMIQEFPALGTLLRAKVFSPATLGEVPCLTPTWDRQTDPDMLHNS